MSLTLHLPASTLRTTGQTDVSDRTVALVFAFVPIALFALAVAVFGFNPVLDFAAASIG